MSRRRIGSRLGSWFDSHAAEIAYNLAGVSTFTGMHPCWIDDVEVASGGTAIKTAFASSQK